jgi:hypothetical protein
MIFLSSQGTYTELSMPSSAIHCPESQSRARGTEKRKKIELLSLTKAMPE